MRRHVKLAKATVIVTVGLGSLLLQQRVVHAHCDTLDGPVVTDARQTLEKGDVTPVLKWVKKENEQEIREAFSKTLVVRGKGPEAKGLADTYFFETLVRIHREGEGAPYAGLKPAASVEPGIAAADQVLAKGSVDALVKEVTEAVAHGIRERFERGATAQKQANTSVDAGREFVEAYVEFIHYVERLHNDATTGAAHHEASEAERGEKQK